MGNYFAQMPGSDEAFVATMLLRMPGIKDVISKEHVCLGWFKNRGLIRGISGGHTMTFPLIIQESGVPTWFTGLDPVSKDFTPGLTAAEYSWSWVSHPVRMEYTTRWENSGEAAVLSVEEARFMQSRKTLLNDLESKFISGAGGKEPTGFATAIEAAAVGSQAQVVGGIDKATNQWWNNQFREATAGQTFGNNVATGAANYFARGVLLAMQLFIDCTIGNSTPSVGFATRAGGENFLRAMIESHALRSMGRVDETLEPTPHSISIFGKPIIPSSQIPANNFFWIKADAEESVDGLQNKAVPDALGEMSISELGGMFCAYHNDVNLTLDGPRVPGGQHAEYWFMLHSMCPFYQNIAQQGRLAGTGGGSIDTY